MDDVPLRQRVCRTCGTLFAICLSCDRGHAYCSAACRVEGRRTSARAARGRHQRSPEGRLDHRDHQRALRARRRVMDQSSAAPVGPVTLPPVAPPLGQCVRCGRRSRWITWSTARARPIPEDG